MEAVLERAKKRGVKELHVGVVEENEVALRLYGGCGFEKRYLLLEAELG